MYKALGRVPSAGHTPALRRWMQDDHTFVGILGYRWSLREAWCLEENSFFKKSPANIESFHHQEPEMHLCLPSTTEVNNATMFCYHDVPTSQQNYRTEGHGLWSPWNHKLNNFLLLKGKNEMERQGWEEREGGAGRRKHQQTQLVSSQISSVYQHPQQCALLMK